MQTATKTGDYQIFLNRKRKLTETSGFEVEPDRLNAYLFDWQRDLAVWHCRRGRSASFCDTGLGKTILQLAWAEQVVKRHGDVLILCPLAVAQQTKREAEKFNIAVEVAVCRESGDVQSGINVTNYERLHKFNVKDFAGVVLDESAILKAYTGKTKQQLCNLFRSTRFKLACSATPAPNDYLELGNHSDFLNVMPSNEMISRWFINDSMRAGSYRLRHHAAEDFWRWITSWAVCVAAPSDLGYSDDQFLLPPLRKHLHELGEEACPPPPGFLLNVCDVSATNQHAVKRQTIYARAEKVAELVTDLEPWVIWCDTNYEADELAKVLPNAVEIRGSDSIEDKEERLIAFTTGQIRQLLSKPEIAGHGLNWQHCNKMVFAGLSFSFERMYQAIRRCWRFGQTKPVDVHLVSSSAEGSILRVLDTKEHAFLDMRRGMQDAVRESQLESIYGNRELEPTIAGEIQVPPWLHERTEE